MDEVTSVCVFAVLLTPPGTQCNTCDCIKNILVLFCLLCNSDKCEVLSYVAANSSDEWIFTWHVQCHSLKIVHKTLGSSE